jgi:hypothetical protein
MTALRRRLNVPIRSLSEISCSTITAGVGESMRSPLFGVPENLRDAVAGNATNAAVAQEEAFT